jgi:hypothetical protein
VQPGFKVFKEIQALLVTRVLQEQQVIQAQLVSLEVLEPQAIPVQLESKVFKEIPE